MTEKATNLSSEVKAMATIGKELAELDDDARKRVLHWAAARYHVAVAAMKSGLAGESTQGSDKTDHSTEKFQELADLYAAGSPKTDADKALVVAYWFQYMKGEPDLEAQKMNGELKHLGHGVKNITAALYSLIDRKPQLVVQTRKSGTTKQARKKYKLTDEGKKAVDRMIKGMAQES